MNGYVRLERIAGRAACVLGLALMLMVDPIFGAGAQPFAIGQPGLPIVHKDGPALAVRDAINESLSVTSSTVQTLSFVQRSVDSFSTAVEVNGQILTLSLQKHSNRSPDFQVLVQRDASGVLYSVEAPPVMTYRGTVEEWGDARVGASFDGTNLQAVIITSDSMYTVQPVSKLKIPAPDGFHVVYKASDWVNRNGYHCGTTDDQRVAELEPFEVEGHVGVPRGTGLKTADLGLDADFEFYQLNGSSVANTVLDMENVVNAVETIFETECTIEYETTTIIVRATAADPYTSTDPVALLTEFQTNWNAAPQNAIRRDTAHLFTGKNINGGTIGIAFLGVVCFQSSAYGLSQSRFTGSFSSRVALTAHEIGHNWNANHCDDPTCPGYPACCRIMCSGLGGCSGGITSFGTYSSAQIVAFKGTRTCLLDLADPQVLPFFEDFATTTLNTGRWSYNAGGVITTTGVGEPSAPNAMELDATAATDYRDDDLRTNFILLSGLMNVRLSYNVQHRGVENGEQLVVEYLTNLRIWAELNRLTSDGVDETTFQFYTHVLPANAYHNEFRVRFRPEVSETNDDWFVDDVLVSNSCTVDTDCNDNIFCNGTETCVATACTLGPAPCSGQLCRESDDTCVNCLTNGNCSNGVFCDGTEICNPAGNCEAGTFPCTLPQNPHCVEATDQCVECLNAAECDDGVFCSGVETCTGNVCVSPGDPCSPLACNEAGDACVPPGDMYCQLASANAAPSSSVDLDIFVVDVNDIRSFQTTISITQTSGTGTVTLNCPSATVIDDARPDYIFFSLTDLPLPNCALKRITSAVTVGSSFVGATPKYLGTYTLSVSGSATPGSTFDIAILGGANSTLRNEANQLVTFDILPACTLTIVNVVCDPPTVDVDAMYFGITPAANIVPQALLVTSPTDWPCVSEYVQADGSLGAAPVFQMAAAWDTVFAHGDAIYPSSDYEVAADCGGLLSSGVAATTPAYGDVDGSGVVDVDDLGCVLAGFPLDFTLLCTQQHADIAPCDPNGMTDVDDLGTLLDAFAGNAASCPPPCP
ncbi:MAG: M12 family metallo-peptidase [Planctomycetota bacterium]